MEKQEKGDSYSHILKYTGLFGGVQGLNILVGIVRNKLVAMILGPEGMGLVALFNSTIKLVSDSTNFGIPMSAVRHVSEALASGRAADFSHAVRLTRSWSLATALLGMLLCAAASPLLNDWTFSWGDHTFHFVLLAPAVGLLAVAGGELAILKGARRLSALAGISVCNMVLSLLLSVPLYYFMGQRGIVPSLVLMALVQCLLVVGYSYRRFPPSFKFGASQFREGRGMARLGLAFVVAGVLGSSAEFVVRSYLNNNGDLAAVGLYNAGFVMTMTYAGMVFSAMETDYFPRLSSIRSLGPELNVAVNRQVEVSLLLVSPMLVAFVVGLPVLLPLLYSGKFLPVLGMMQVTVLAMYFRALTLPVEYIALSRGDTRGYLVLEAFYDLVFVLLVIAGYEQWGLVGTGVGLALAGMANVLVVYAYAHRRYGYSVAPSACRYALVQLPLGGAACLAVHTLEGTAYWVVGLLIALVSLAVSIKILRAKSTLWEALVAKVRRKLGRGPSNRSDETL